ncbi:MAG: FtsH protease activity modulator HflK [Candidatus Protistobacter heckmanni]|nr:FtsH protease activity modulator HflK [Candidatus Protistobacter heckmanni]
MPIANLARAWWTLVAGKLPGFAGKLRGMIVKLPGALYAAARKLPFLSQGDKPRGPPDLDELWRDFNRKLNGLFGRKGGGGNGKIGVPGANNGKGAGVGAGVFIGVLAVIWIASGFFIIQEGQQGVVLQFGKFKYIAGPGINWRMPWPLQSHEIVNVSGVRSVEIGRSTQIKDTNLLDSSMLTEDENIINMRFAVQYRIKDATEFLFNNRDAEATVMQAAETAVREIVGRNKMDYVLYEGRGKIFSDLAVLIQRLLDSYKSGILVTSVTMVNVQPPEQVQASFDDANKAGQDRERAKNEGEAYANDVVPRARGAAARLIEEAEGYKARLVLQAEGDAARFKQLQAEYAKAPQVTRDRLYLETMQQVLNNTTKVLVDARQGSQLLYLPLDKLISQVGTDAKQAATGAPATPAPDGSLLPPSLSSSTPEAAAADIRSREAMRNRDRDTR